MLFVCGLIFTATSCSQDDDLSSVVIQEETVVENAARAPLAWNYDTRSWSSSGTSSTGWLYCYNAQGTNQTAKRAVFTISNDSYSTGSVTVTIQVTSNACPNTPLQQVKSFVVPAGGNVTEHIIVDSYPSSETRLRLNIKPSLYGTGSYSGSVTYGYEY